VTVNLGLKWGDPPGAGRRVYDNTKWARIADALRERPGEWALVTENGTSGSNSNALHLLARRGPGFEVTSRKQPDNTVNVWARYVGNGAS
jgi:hypothetical protein